MAIHLLIFFALSSIGIFLTLVFLLRHMPHRLQNRWSQVDPPRKARAAIRTFMSHWSSAAIFCTSRRMACLKNLGPMGRPCLRWCTNCSCTISSARANLSSCFFLMRLLPYSCLAS